MKYSQLIPGTEYKTKIDGVWQLVTLISLRSQFNTGKSEREKEVIIRTGAGNQIYRTPSQLKSQ